MSKLTETNELVKVYARAEAAGLNLGNGPILLDIAKSLAIIADSLSEKEEEEEA